MVSMFQITTRSWNSPFSIIICDSGTPQLCNETALAIGISTSAFVAVIGPNALAAILVCLIILLLLIVVAIVYTRRRQGWKEKQVGSRIRR
jgi:hypothetical protein